MADWGESSRFSALLSSGCRALVASTQRGWDSIITALGRYFSHSFRWTITGSVLFWKASEASTRLLTGSLPARDHSKARPNREAISEKAAVRRASSGFGWRG